MGAWLKLRSLVPDRFIPATLNAGHCIPTIVQALVFIRLVQVDPGLLCACIIAAVVGSLVGSWAVLRVSVRIVQGTVGKASFDDGKLVGLITINPGWRQIPHVCTIAYGPNVVAPLPFTIDTIAGIYLKELDAHNSDSEDGITRKFSGMVMLPILWNGIPSLIWPSTIGAVG